MRYLLALLLFPAVTILAAEPGRGPRLDGHGDPLPPGALARLGTSRFQLGVPEPARSVRFRWFGHAPMVALAPDGRTAATISFDDKKLTVNLLDAQTGQGVRRLELPELNADQMQLTPDGKELLFYHWSSFKWLNLASGKITRSIEIKDCRQTGVALSADGRWLAVQPQQHVLHAAVSLLDAKNGKPIASLPGRGASCKRLVFSPDGKRLLLWSIVPTEVTPNSMSYGPESKGAVVCIDVTARKIIAETQVASAHYVALGPDGETVALELPDGKGIRIHHLPAGQDRCVIPAKSSQFAFTPVGNLLAVFDPAGRGALWDAAKGTKARDLEGELVNKDFALVGIAQDGGTIAALDGGWESAPLLVVWDAATGQRRQRPPGHQAAITCLAYAPDGRFLATGSFDKTVRLWSAATGEQVRLLARHDDAITALAVSADGERVASASQDGLIRLTKTADGQAVDHFKAPERGAKSLAFSRDGTLLFAGGQTAEALAWRIADGKEIHRLKTGPNNDIMAFGAGGALALTANSDHDFFEESPAFLHVWQTGGKLAPSEISLRHEKGGNVRCYAALFSADSRLLAASQISVYQGIRPSYGADLLRVWERASGQPIRTLAPAITSVLAFSPDGRLLAAGAPGKSGHLRVGIGSGLDIWDCYTGHKVAALAESPNCAAFSPDGRFLATGGWDHGVLIWEAPRLQPPKQVRPPADAEKEAWWTALASNAPGAYQAMAHMIDQPGHAVPLLKERVRPLQAADPKEVAKLILQMDGQQFAERMAAQEALEKMGESATHLVTQALNGNVNLELRRRLEEVLRNTDATSPASLRLHRAIAILERANAPAARDLLKELASGAPGARLTNEAQTALQRLKD